MAPEDDGVNTRARSADITYNMNMGTELTLHESARLTELEAVVERGMQTFVDVGQALMEIRDARLYRETYPTFNAYCQQRFGFSDSRGRQLIAAAKTVTDVTARGLPAPKTEGEARALARSLREAEQPPVISPALTAYIFGGDDSLARRALPVLDDLDALPDYEENSKRILSSRTIAEVDENEEVALANLGRRVSLTHEFRQLARQAEGGLDGVSHRAEEVRLMYVARYIELSEIEVSRLYQSLDGHVPRDEVRARYDELMSEEEWFKSATDDERMAMVRARVFRDGGGVNEHADEPETSGEVE